MPNGTTLTPQMMKSNLQGIGGGSPTPQPNTSFGKTSLTPQQMQDNYNQMKGSSPAAQKQATPSNSWDAYDRAMSGNSITQKDLNNPMLSGKSDYFSQVGNAASSGMNQVQQGEQEFRNSGGNPLIALEAAGKGVAGAIGVITSPAAPVTNAIGSVVNAVSDKISNNPSVQSFAASPAGQVTSRIAEDVGNFATIAGGLAGAAAMGEGAKPPPEMVGPTTPAVPPEAPPAEPTAPLNEKVITDNYNRAIKPSITGKSNATQIAQANDRVVSGVKSIVNNKANLSFTDENGTVIKGQTPTTVQQMSDAIQQTKASIYQKYNALATQAGEKGITVDAPAIAKELQPVIESKALQITSPETIKYAQDLQTRLTAQGGIDPKTAQSVIENYNAELKSFYRNPTPGAASRVQIDAMIANKFREQLDSGITGATGSQYQALKTEYGALKSMEADVARKAASVAKQNRVGMVSNLTDIASGATLLKGLLTHNPVEMAFSGAMKGIELYTKYLNNPDTGVQKMFGEANRASPPTTVPEQTGQLKQEIPSTNPTTIIE